MKKPSISEKTKSTLLLKTGCALSLRINPAIKHLQTPHRHKTPAIIVIISAPFG